LCLVLAENRGELDKRDSDESSFGRTETQQTFSSSECIERPQLGVTLSTNGSGLRSLRMTDRVGGTRTVLDIGGAALHCLLPHGVRADDPALRGRRDALRDDQATRPGYRHARQTGPAARRSRVRENRAGGQRAANKAYDDSIGANFAPELGVPGSRSGLATQMERQPTPCRPNRLQSGSRRQERAGLSARVGFPGLIRVGESVAGRPKCPLIDDWY
jgi:hypothetical protein